MSLLKFYLGRGWQEYPDQFHPHATSLYAPIADRVNLSDCECNDKPPGLYLRENPAWQMSPTESYDVELCGQRDGIWLKFQAYNLRTGGEIEEGIAAVKAAWQAHP